MGESTKYRRPDGGQTDAYLARPAKGDRAPSVVVIQEWWGLNPQIKSVADRLAAGGWRAFVPDLYHGKLATAADEANHLMSTLDWTAAVEQDLKGAIDHLSANGQKVAVMGFCMGGALTLFSASRYPDAIAAAVCFYGIPPSEAADPSKIKAPLLCHFAKKDDWCTPKAVDALEEKLKAGKVPYELYRYDAQHAFFNEARPEVYDAQASLLAWDRTVSFLEKHL
jgi:carboxymethylenebutenolidase